MLFITTIFFMVITWKLAGLVKRLEKLINKCPPSTPQAERILILFEGKEITHMFFKVNQKLPVTIAIKDKFGNDAKVDGAPAWALSDETLGALEIAEGGMAATFTPSGKVGAVLVQVKADADLGEGIKEILGELSLELLAGEAVVVELAAGEATDI